MCRRDFDEWHCNAHANNLVLLPQDEGMEQQSFLSYLDLDMAFDDKTFVDPWDAPAFSATHAEDGRVASAGDLGIGREAYDRLLLRECVNFMEVLAGGDTSNGVPMVAKATVDAQGARLHAVRAGLYDTLVLGYLRGYHDDDAYPAAMFHPVMHKAAYAIAKLAVVVMADFVA